MRIATKTLEAIEANIAEDQGNRFRYWLGQVIPHVGDAYRQNDDPYRTHLGASGIGSKCPRAIWFSFRWATKTFFNGRLLRLFNRGHLEEARFIAMLLAIGAQVYQQDENGNQYRISDAGGHYGGSGDGLAFGIPDLPNEWVLLEFKTAGDKPFAHLVKNGVKISKPEHYTQMQQYMGYMEYRFALYMAVNKNNDELHAEIIEFDAENFGQYSERGVSLVFQSYPPDRISKSPASFNCKFCDHINKCFGREGLEVNCRTCTHSVPATDGKWYCGKDHEHLDKARQLVGCEFHRPWSID